MLTDLVLNRYAVDWVVHKYCHFVYLCGYQIKYKKKTEIRLVMIGVFGGEVGFMEFCFPTWCVLENDEA